MLCFTQYQSEFCYDDVVLWAPCGINYKHYFRSLKQLLDEVDAEGSSPLHLAEEKRMYKKVEILLESGAG